MPEIKERKTFFYHEVGNSVYLSLDTGYVTTFEGQVNFINSTLTNYKDYFKFANYH